MTEKRYYMVSRTAQPNASRKSSIPPSRGLNTVNRARKRRICCETNPAAKGIGQQISRPNVGWIHMQAGCMHCRQTAPRYTRIGRSNACMGGTLGIAFYLGR